MTHCCKRPIPLLLKDDVDSNFTSAQQTLIFTLAGYNFTSAQQTLIFTLAGYNFTSAQQTLIFTLAGYNFLLFFIILVTVHSFFSVEIHLILFHEF